MISGDSGPFDVKGIAGKKKILKVNFRGHNESGYGPTTGPFTYTIDLTGSSLDPKIAMLPMSGPPGTTFVEWGTGFTPKKTATLHFKKPDGSEYPTLKQSLDSIGHFEISYKAPLDKPLGTHCWWAIDDQTKRQSNEVCFQVTGSTGTITGRLHDGSSSGAALSGAKVTCGGQSTATKSDGAFSISGVPAGNQILSFSLSGYLTYEGTISIIARQIFDAGDRWLVKNPSDPSVEGPNLAIHELEIKKSSEDDSELGHKLRLEPGEKFDIKVRIKNRGKTKAKKAFTVKYLLSDDSRITSGDTVIGIDKDKTDIKAGKTLTEWKQKIAAPAVPGTYYVGAWVDSPEDNEKENDFSRGDKERGRIIIEIPNRQPEGLLESSTCVSITGWARDPDTTSPIKVDIYADGPAGSGTFLGEASAGAYRSDLSYADKYHGFTFYTPSSLKDGKSHTIYAYAIDSAGGVNPLLDGSSATLTCDAPLRPFIKSCSVMAYNYGISSQMTTLLDICVSDPDGSVPNTLASINVSGPDGFNYDFVYEDYIIWSPGEFFHLLSGMPADGKYVFTVTDLDGNKATSYSYLSVGQTIPIPDYSQFRATGTDPLVPTLSWSTIPGYVGNLFYRVIIHDAFGNGVWISSTSFNNTSVTVPSGKLSSGESYTWKVDAFDNYAFPNSNKRSGIGIPLTVDVVRPYFSRVTALKYHNPDGSFSTILSADVGDPANSLVSLVVTDPDGSQYSLNVDEECSSESDSLILTCSKKLEVNPPAGLYAFAAKDSENAASTSYFHLDPYDVPLIDSATARASGDILAPVLSWSAPAAIDKTLYYVVSIADTSQKVIWSSSVTTQTSVSVPEGTLESGIPYLWKVKAYDSPYYSSANVSDMSFKALTIDNTYPYFSYAVAYNRHQQDGNFTSLNVRVGIPGGSAPDDVASLTVSGPDGFSYSFQPSDCAEGNDEYWHAVPGHPQEGLYTFTVTGSNGNSSVTYSYHRHLGGTLPLLDESSFEVSGNLLAPMISWATVSGYPQHLYYNVRIVDEQGNWVYSSGNTAYSYRVIPPGKLMPGVSYRYRVEVHDSLYFPGFDNRAVSSYLALPEPVSTNELQYDNGVSEVSSSPWTNEPGSEIAVRFTSWSYPFALEGARFYVTSSGKPTTPFGVRIYRADNGEYPGSRLDPGTITAQAERGNLWVDLDLSSLGIVVNEGDFFISMYWITAPGEDGALAQALGADSDEPLYKRSYYKWGASGAWSLRESRNAMIRARTGGSSLQTTALKDSASGSPEQEPFSSSSYGQ